MCHTPGFERELDRADQFLIGGHWTGARSGPVIPVDDPSCGEVIAHVAEALGPEIDAAVKAARQATVTESLASRDVRIQLLERVIEIYRTRLDDLAEAVSREMGAPLKMAREAQAMAGMGQLASALTALRAFEFEHLAGSTMLRHDPIGVCALITPWNWPLNQICAKVGPALAAGCPVVLKPSEVAPISALVFAEILQEAAAPPGVFNLVNGSGPGVGAALAGHPDVDMVSFTGSTGAGAAVAVAAAPTVKRVCQELGGKSAHIVLDDADTRSVVSRAVRRVMANSGQSCDSVARILVATERLEEAIEVARVTAEAVIVGQPSDANTEMGPLASAMQLERVTGLVDRAVADGAVVVTGGSARVEALGRGYFMRPTVIAAVHPDMEIAREEIFGPVALVMAYSGDDEAVEIANDTPYGLSGRVSSADHGRALRIARRLRTGMVYLNDAGADFDAPFGGYRMSGNGREGGEFGLREYLETQAVMGAAEGVGTQVA